MPAWLAVTLVDLDRTTQDRLAWADISKAVSIILLVFWTTLGDRYYLNEMLILLRMPLFFFVSGLFAWRIVATASFAALMRERVGNLLYLYVLWIWLLFLTTDLVDHVVTGASADPWRRLEIFWDPLFTIWFLYALAVAVMIAWMVRRLPILLVLALALSLYCVSVASGDWRHLEFAERVIRLFPFFWIGLCIMPVAGALVERWRRAWPLLALAFLGGAFLVVDSPLNRIGPVTFAVSLIGIAATLTFARTVAPYPFSRPLILIGASTLYIYVMQRIVLHYLEMGADIAGLAFRGIDAVYAVVILALSTLVGRWIAAGPWGSWLFTAPWLLGGRSRPGRPIVATGGTGNR